MNKQVFAGFFLFFSLGVILFFQNCSQSNLANMENASSAASSKVERLSAVDFNNIQTISFGSSSSGVAMKVSSDGLYHQIELSLDMRSGDLLETDKSFDSVTKQWATNQKNYCVPKIILDKLNQALNGASLCKRVLDNSANLVCTMSMIEPYAQLRGLNDQYSLGAASNGCRDGEIDLCGDQSLKMRAISEEIKLNYQQYACQ